MTFPIYGEDVYKTIDDIKKDTNTVIELISEGQFEKGLGILKDHSILSNEQIDSLISQLKAQEKQIKSTYGNIIGAEFISEKQIGSCLYEVKYITKFEKYAMQWIFLFYKGIDEWKMTNLTFNDKINELFGNN